jgi:TRIAD3 protein (E3 ubiquitin-protein ligase RNF216)
VTDYSHFGDVQTGKCPLHENIENRHELEVKRAADEAMAKVRADNPGVSDVDLMVKVSDRVKQAEEARRGQVQAEAQAFPYHMVGNQLQRVPRVAQRDAPRPLIPLPPTPMPLPAPQYVYPYPAVVHAPVPRQPVQPVPFHQHLFPIQPMNYYGNVPPQQPYRHLFHHPLIVPCQRCHLYHPPNQYC